MWATLAEDVFKTFGFTQTVKAGNTIYFSGIAPLTGDAANLQLVGEGDVRAQLEFCLQVQQRCLEAVGATFANLVAQTFYVTNMAEASAHFDLFPKFYGDHTPSSTGVEVKGLFHSQQMVELTGIAVLD